MLIALPKKPALSFILLLNVFLATAQTEYSVIVDPTNANLTKIDSIPGLMWLASSPAYDQTTKRGTVLGKWDMQPMRLFTVNAASGVTISNPLVPAPGILAMEYSRTTGILYGIIYNNSTALCYLATIDPASGVYTIIRDIPGLTGVSDPPVIDEAYQHLFIGSGGRMLTIDLATGNILANPVLTQYFFGGRFDNVSRNMYGLTFRLSPTPGSSSIFSICKVDVVFGNITIIADLTGVSSVIGVGGNTTYNENDGIFYFEGNAPGPGEYLYSVDVNTGNILTIVPVPSSGVVDHDNLVFFRYDNPSGKLYAWFWEGHTVTVPPPPPTPPHVIVVPADSSCRMDVDTKIYFSPANHSFVVNKKNTSCSVHLTIYNMLGQQMMKNKIINDGNNEIALPGFSNGIYYYEFIADNNKVLLSGRFFKQ